MMGVSFFLGFCFIFFYFYKNLFTWQMFYKCSTIHYSLSLSVSLTHTQSMAHYNKEAPALYTKREHLRRLAAARGHFCAVARGPATQHYLHLLQQVILS
jgi:hypothetical protein